MKTHTSYSVKFSSENRVIYEILWKNMVESGRTGDHIIWQMCVACWITKATNTHS